MTRTPERAGSLVGRGPTKPADVRPSGRRHTQEDLAGLAGTSRATVNRALRELEQAGAIAQARGRVDVLDLALLADRGR